MTFQFPDFAAELERLTLHDQDSFPNCPSMFSLHLIHHLFVFPPFVVRGVAAAGGVRRRAGGWRVIGNRHDFDAIVFVLCLVVGDGVCSDPSKVAPVGPVPSVFTRSQNSFFSWSVDYCAEN